MSSSFKKNCANSHGNNPRQSSLLAFFQRTPKQMIEDKKPNALDGELANRENTLPDTPVKQQDSNNKQQQKTILPKKRKEHKKRSVCAVTKTTQSPTTHAFSSEDDDDNVVGFLSCSSSSTVAPPAKRSRIIISSDDEEEELELEITTSKIIKNIHPNNTPNKNEINHKFDQNTTHYLELMESKNSNKNEVHIKEADNTIMELEENEIPKTKQQEQQHGFTQSFINSFSFDSALDTQTSTSLQYEHPQENVKENRSAAAKTQRNREEKPDVTSTSCDIRGGEYEHFPHLNFSFLKPDKIKDAQGKSPSDPEYDSRTLYLPKHFLDEQSPGHQQWWKMKAAHFDTILFFKVGKFYELYHMDAVVAVENLGLTYMRGKFAHCGFPEVGYGRFADQLVNRGYKVARVEQTETPQQLNERQKNSKKMSSSTPGRCIKEKVVRREICRVTTKGTKTYGVLDGTDNREMDGTTEPNASYLMALTEQKCDYQKNGAVNLFRYGCCFVDCSVGRFVLSEFDDDFSQSNLRTLLAHNYPAQLLYAKCALSTATITLLNTMLANVPKEVLFLNRQFRTAESTLALLCDDNYFGTDKAQWPDALRQALSDSDACMPQPTPEKRLCLSAFGAVLWYLQECLIDVDVVSMKQFEYYMPLSTLDNLDFDKLVKKDGRFRWRDKHMILDGVSLLNLHILPALTIAGSQSRTIAKNNGFFSFSLYNTINRCQTAFGKRLLRQWISAPSCCPDVLLSRQKAIQWLSTEWMRPHTLKCTELLRKVPDLERLFQRIHTIGHKYRAEPEHGHPDARAQFFEMDKYNKRKIRDFTIMLDGLEEVQRLFYMFNHINELANESAPVLLQKCFDSSITEMSEDLKFFKKAFDRKHALENGIILPNIGVDKDYDQTCIAIEQCKLQLNEYLDRIKQQLKSSAIKFAETGRNTYHIEIPDAYCKNLTVEFKFNSQRKGFKRYTTPELERLIAQLDESLARCDTISAEVTRRVFADFDAKKNKWSAIVFQMATFDCLLALTLYAQNSSQQMCIPEFDFDSDEPFLIIERGYHPTLISRNKIEANNNNIDYIPNSCHLGTNKKSRTMLLTGPNMGGKSTYMRQVASLVVLAQIGSMVPANTMRLTPVDRVFCRIGASDRLSIGQSTFYVELSETNIILCQATKNSLVLIDELGRGTSTYDGTAIACAVLKHISKKICCRTLFSTHYHALYKFVVNIPDIQFAHMACMVENANLEDPTLESITFLYTLSAGMCDKSYGFYTAKMAGLDIEIVRKAFDSSSMLEK